MINIEKNEESRASWLRCSGKTVGRRADPTVINFFRLAALPTLGPKMVYTYTIQYKSEREQE